MNNHSEQTWVRLKITGALQCQSPLLIGSGDVEPGPDDGDEDYLIKALMLDNEQNPFVPASTLRGYLRASFEACPDIGDEALLHFFGIGRRNADETTADDAENYGQAGCLYAYDAKLLGSCKLVEQQRIMMNPVTGTVQEHMLVNEKLVDAGTRFRCEFEIVKPTTFSDLIYLLRALNTLQALGQGKSIGRGQMQWQLDSDGLQGINEQAMSDWLLAENNVVLPYQTVPLDSDEIAELSTPWQHFSADIYAMSPCIINAPELVSEDKGSPKLQFRRVEDASGNTKALIPASSLKGMLRARCSKILNTVIEDEQYIVAILDGLFGSTDSGAGCLRFVDSYAPYTSDEEHLQTFTAIDRFTGGVTEGALYSVNAVQPTSPFALSIYYHEKRLNNEMRGLLLHLLHDAMDGDLSIGWGKSKGFGRLQLSFEECSDWYAYVDTWDDKQRSQVLDYLQAFDHLKGQVTEETTHD